MGAVCFYGGGAGDVFVPQPAGTVEYRRLVTEEAHMLSYGKGIISCGVIPFDKYGSRGAMVSGDNFGFVSAETGAPFVMPAD